MFKMIKIKRYLWLLIGVLALSSRALAWTEVPDSDYWDADAYNDDIWMPDSSVIDAGISVNDSSLDYLLTQAQETIILPPIVVSAGRIRVPVTASWNTGYSVNIMLIFGTPDVISGSPSSNAIDDAQKEACIQSVDSTYDEWLKRMTDANAKYLKIVDDLKDIANQGITEQNAKWVAWTQANLGVIAANLVSIAADTNVLLQGTLITDGPAYTLKTAANAKFTADALILANWKVDAYTYCGTSGRFSTPVI